MALLVTVVLLILLLWYWNRWINGASVKLAYNIPSSKLQTFFGWGKIGKIEDKISNFCEYGKKYGPNSILWIGPVPNFLSSDPQIVKEILSSKNCVDKPRYFYHGFSFVLGSGILSSSGDVWSQHRKLLNKAFSNKILLSWLPIFRTNVDSVIAEIGANLDKGEMVDMLQIFRILTLKNATQTLLKRNLDLTKYEAGRLADDFSVVMEYVGQVILSPTMRISWLNKILDRVFCRNLRKSTDFIARFVNESININQRNDTTDPSYMPEVISALDFAVAGVQQNIMNNTELEEEMMHLFLAAFDTTSYTLYLVIVLLAMHPEHQERVYEEIISITPGNGSELTPEQLDQLVYLEMVFNETLRLFPVGPDIARTVANESVCLSNGVTLPVGMSILIDIYSIHRRTDIWGPDADAFNPDNFLPENIKARHSFSFVPFTKGLRTCIGTKYANLLAKVALGNLIKYFKFTTDFKYDDLIAENHATLKLRKEPSVYLERRSGGIKSY